MLPIDPLTAGTLLVMAVTSTPFCQMPEPAKISVIPKTHKVKIDTSQTLKQIQSEVVNTINPYGFDSMTHTNGYMRGGISWKTKVDLDNKYSPRTGGYCIWYKSVDIELEIDPTIVIGKEVAKDRCMYKAVLKHEMRHVNADKIIVNKFAKSMGQKVFDGLKERGFIVGPIPADNVQAVATRMQETISQFLELEHKKMDIERAELQQSIDSLEEYTSVQAKCPNYRPPDYMRK